MLKLRALVAACGSALVSIALQASSQEPSPAVIVIDDVTLIDVENGRAIEHQSITIAGERIERIDEAAKAQIPEGATVIPGKGLFLIPGLFDAHVHFTASAETFGPMLLANGVTAVRDTGADTNTIVALRTQSQVRGAMLPQIICTGAIIDGDPPVWPFSEACDTADEARAAVRKLKDAGVDMIKVYSRLQPEVYRAAVAEAHAVGLKVTGHVPNAVTLAEALEAGQDCAEHLMGLDRMLVELSGKPADDRQGIWPGLSGWLRMPDIDRNVLRQRLEQIARAGMVQCPTVVVIQGMAAAGDAETAGKDERMAYVPTSLRAFWASGDYAEFGKFAGAFVPHMKAMVGELHKAGVTLMVGTDLANPFIFAGFSLHDEMKNFSEAGVPAADILRSATIIPARFCGVDDDLGSIARGKLASMVLLRANPLGDIANASRIQSVFVRGVHHDRAELDKMLEGVREYVSSTTPAAGAAGVDMNLEGELVARGRYSMKFNGQFDAGVEDFVITRDKAGYHVRSHSQPQGGYAPPSVVTFHVDPAFKFISAEMKQLTAKPLTATYELKDRTLTATAVEGAENAKPQEFSMPDNGLVTASVNACDFVIFGAVRDLAIDATREFRAVGFGFGGWQVGAVPYTVTRKADEEFTKHDGTKVQAQRIDTMMTSQGMEMKGQSWFDDKGVLLRTVLRAPFGTIETTLVETKDQ